MTLFRSRVLGRSVLGALVIGFAVPDTVDAQPECPQYVDGVTNYGSRLYGELIGTREQTTTKVARSGSTTGALSGTATSGTVSGTAKIEGRSGTTTTATVSTTKIGAYQFENGSRYEVDCSTLMTTQQLVGFRPGQGHDGGPLMTARKGRRNLLQHHGLARFRN